MALDIQIDKPFGATVPAELLERVAAETLAFLTVGEEVEIGVLVTGDKTVRELNRQYRGLDETTDVLAFALRDAAEPFTLPPGVPSQMGEVVISYPQAERQAREAGNPLEREICLLLIHGLLHLFGHDHEEPEEEREMFALQASILERVFPPGSPGTSSAS